MSALHVLEWSQTIHNNGERHEWAKAAAKAMECGHEVPDFPSRFISTRVARLDTAKRLFGQPDDRIADLCPRCLGDS